MARRDRACAQVRQIGLGFHQRLRSQDDPRCRLGEFARQRQPVVQAQLRRARHFRAQVPPRRRAVPPIRRSSPAGVHATRAGQHRSHGQRPERRAPIRTDGTAPGPERLDVSAEQGGEGHPWCGFSWHPPGGDSNAPSVVCRPSRMATRTAPGSHAGRGWKAWLSRRQQRRRRSPRQVHLVIIATWAALRRRPRSRKRARRLAMTGRGGIAMVVEDSWVLPAQLPALAIPSNRCALHQSRAAARLILARSGRSSSVRRPAKVARTPSAPSAIFNGRCRRRTDPAVLGELAR